MMIYKKTKGATQAKYCYNF